jgi:hypothetical protein
LTALEYSAIFLDFVGLEAIRTPNDEQEAAERLLEG